MIGPFNPIPVPEDSAGLKFLYHTAVGRAVLKCMTVRSLSTFAGNYLDSKHSTWLIRSFIEKNGIDLSEYEDCEFSSFNEFFCRQIRKENRPFDLTADHLPSPCDGLLSVYHIEDGLIVPIKESRYSVADLLQNKQLADEFNGGVCMVFRLCVNHYHRYAYPDAGTKGKNIFIPGALHTVRPIALRSLPVFNENCREYTVLETENFGKMVMMEVGAMLVGKIDNYHQEASFTRGQEKGRFLYGGSTVVLLLKKEYAERCTLFTDGDYELPVKMGQRLL